MRLSRCGPFLRATALLLLLPWLLPSATWGGDSVRISVVDESGAASRWGAPVSVEVDLEALFGAEVDPARLRLHADPPNERQAPEAVAVQFEADAAASGDPSLKGRLWWTLDGGAAGERRFTLSLAESAAEAALKVETGEYSETRGAYLDVSEGARQVLRYSHGTVPVPADVDAGYARGDYISVLRGLGGEVLTADYPKDHPHHRGVSWSWPVTRWGSDVRDIWAVRGVRAHPVAVRRIEAGPVFARIVVESAWRWGDDREIVREEASIRVFRQAHGGRFVDCDVRLRAVERDVAIGGRPGAGYGGFGLRGAPAEDRVITRRQDAEGATPRRSVLDYSGRFEGRSTPSGVAILEHPENPGYPSALHEYPDCDYVMPAFPGDREVPLSTDAPLVLRHRLWIHEGLPRGGALEDAWSAYARPPRARLSSGPGPRVERVVVVFKTHFDIGYTDLARNVVTKYRTSMIDRALEVCDATRALPPRQRFVWTLSGWPMSQILWEGQDPDRRRRIEQAVRDGLLVWHGLPGTLHTESLDLEDIVRGLGFSSRLSRRFHQELPADAKMTDVPSHSWALPTILAHAGIRFLHLGCNPASGAPDVPRLFWWEGPDGSRVLTMYSSTDYGTTLEPPAGWPHRTWLALIHTGDNHGPPKPEEVRELLESAKTRLPGVEVRLGRLSDFGDAIIAEGADLPVLRLDMPDTWIHGVQSMPVETALARTVRPLIGGLESLNTLLRLEGAPVETAAPAVAAAYETSLLYGEHTWGASSWNYVPRVYGDAWRQARAEGKYAYPEESWAEHGAYVRASRAAVLPALATNLRVLATSVAVSGPRVVVFNPLSWSRADVVEVAVDDPIPRSWKDAETGAVVPSEVRGSTLRLLARDVPPLGYRTYVPDSGRSTPDRAEDSESLLRLDRDGGVVENRYLRARVDPRRGILTSIVEKATGRELVRSGGRWSAAQYLYERFDRSDHESYLTSFLQSFPNWSHELGKDGLPPASEAPRSLSSPETVSVEPFVGDVSAGFVARWSSPHDATLRVSLHRDCPWLDVEWTIEGKRAEPWPEAGWLSFPIEASEPSFLLGRLGGPVDPARDTVRSSNHEIFCVDTGVLVLGRDGTGVGLCPIEAPLLSLGAPGIFRFSRSFSERDPTVFVNLFNNHWGTNFQQWIEGSWSSRVRLWAVTSDPAQGAAARHLVIPGREARSPCLGSFVRAEAGGLPTTYGGVDLSRPGIVVTALGDSPDGEGIVLRLWEQVGEGGPVKARLPRGLAQARPRRCDLRGRPQGDPLRIEDGSVELVLEPFMPFTLVFERDSETVRDEAGR